MHSAMLYDAKSYVCPPSHEGTLRPLRGEAYPTRRSGPFHSLVVAVAFVGGPPTVERVGYPIHPSFAGVAQHYLDQVRKLCQWGLGLGDWIVSRHCLGRAVCMGKGGSLRA